MTEFEPPEEEKILPDVLNLTYKYVILFYLIKVTGVLFLAMKLFARDRKNHSTRMYTMVS